MMNQDERQRARGWAGYYRWTAARPPRELLIQTLQHVEWERRRPSARRAVDLGCGAGTDTLELLRRGWTVVAVDREPGAARILNRRVPTRRTSALTTLVAPLEGFSVPPADLVYASFSLPFCSVTAFPKLWKSIRDSLRPGGHFAGQLFGNRDEWAGHDTMNFHTLDQVKRLTRGFTIELFRETEEQGRSYLGPKHWHYFDLILEKPRAARA